MTSSPSRIPSVALILPILLVKCTNISQLFRLCPLDGGDFFEKVIVQMYARKNFFAYNKGSMFQNQP